ncbi:DNA translocase FtsK [Blautia glucerasea]|uniref:FtsK/SpoIIIE family DNA translocase n=1 Tax=Blautia glucerasea TaxID=536633 RepID=UPI001D075F24|nr:DNA translocase FtsK [Blautia glucerasea]MCB6368737.1 DNA translocase FtsK [Blautia glucerasea]
MAAKKQNNRRGTAKTTSKKKNTRKRTAKDQGVASGFQTEIILWIFFAASIILIISNLGMGGTVGGSISQASFGIMGLLAYLFPVLLFGCAVFFISNRKNPLAYKKLLAGLVFWIFLCGLVQLLTEGYMAETTFAEYYRISSSYHTGGGVIGGAICISTTSAFGTVGGCVIILLVLLITLILITQKSFFGFIFRVWDAVCAMARDRHALYMEGQPERDLKKELRQQERRMRREQRRAERMKELEEALAEEEETEPEKQEFLAGTKLTPPSAEREMKSVPAEETASSEERVEMEESSQGQVEFKIHRAETPDVPVQEEEEKPSFPVFARAETEEENLPQEVEEIPVKETSEAPTDRTEVTSADDAEDAYEDADWQEQLRNEVRPEPREEVQAAGKEAEESSPAQQKKNPKSSKEEIQSGITNIQKEITSQAEEVPVEYHYPPLKLLKRGDGRSQGDSDEHLRRTAKKLQETLHNFGVNVTITNVSCGPTVTRYELQPEMGVKVSKIVNLADDIKLNLATPDIRIEAPIPGKAAVGIEVPNKENHAVMLREILQSQEFQTAKSKLSFAVGKDIAGKPVVTDIAKMPHLLIAGATGSGKSVCINTLIISILYKASPDEVKLIMIDPKVVELSVYNGIPHLFIPVVTDPKKAAGALNWAVSEMMGRYNTFAEYGVRNLGEYNRKIAKMEVPEGEEPKKPMPQIVIIVDELADLMMVAPGEVEDAICRLAQLARAAGIHLIIATQRPSVNVITGLIKANMPSRIAFSVSSGVDSRTILDMNGAEKLLGKGDMLFYPQGYQKPARLQGAFVSDEEVSGIVEFLADKNPKVSYNTQIEQQVNTISLSGGSSSGSDANDVYFVDAGKFIIEKEKASIGMLQRMFKIGFNRAARIMDQLSDAGVVGPEEGTKPRKVLMSMEEFETYIEEHNV